MQAALPVSKIIVAIFEIKSEPEAVNLLDAAQHCPSEVFAAGFTDPCWWHC